MAHILKMFEFANQNGVAQMQIRRSGIEARFYLKWLAGLGGFLQALAQFLLANDFNGAFL